MHYLLVLRKLLDQKSFESSVHIYLRHMRDKPQSEHLGYVKRWLWQTPWQLLIKLMDRRCSRSLIMIDVLFGLLSLFRNVPPVGKGANIRQVLIALVKLNETLEWRDKRVFRGWFEAVHCLIDDLISLCFGQEKRSAFNQEWRFKGTNQHFLSSFTQSMIKIYLNRSSP